LDDYLAEGVLDLCDYDSCNIADFEYNDHCQDRSRIYVFVLAAVTCLEKQDESYEHSKYKNGAGRYVCILISRQSVIETFLLEAALKASVIVIGKYLRDRVDCQNDMDNNDSDDEDCHYSLQYAKAFFA